MPGRTTVHLPGRQGLRREHTSLKRHGTLHLVYNMFGILRTLEILEASVVTMEKIWFGQSRNWSTGKQGCLVHPDIWQLR
jgi:hypothetical protein